LPVPWEVTVSYGAGTSRSSEHIFKASKQVDIFDAYVPDGWRNGFFMRETDKKLLMKSDYLRKEAELERSIFLHRLQLLEIQWGERQDVSGKGTFKESWRLQWSPELSINIIEKGNLGNTVPEAAEKLVIDKANKADSLSTVTTLLEHTIPAELHHAVEICIQSVNNLAAASGDVIQLMEVVPGLVQVTRYGSVRKTDADLVLGIVNSMLTRICVSLPAACTAVSEDAAQKLLELFFKLNDAVNVLQQTEITRQWQQTLQAIAAANNTSSMIAGYATRLLADYKLLEGDELVRVFHFAMSSATGPDVAAAWLEGFLKGSGTILLIDNDLWGLVNDWVSTLDEETFTRVLPLLRRTFAGFSSPERKKLGEKVKGGGNGITSKRVTGNNLHEERAKQGIPIIMQLLGIKR
jgi:hypothetical protein